jgi:alpha-glucosidase
MPEPILFFQLCLLLCSTFASWARSIPLKRADCPGYKASNVQQTDNGLTADLALAGSECNIHGKDLKELRFLAEVQTGM